MNTIALILLTLGLIIAILIMTYIVLSNKIKYSEIRLNEAEKVIIDELNNRYELIMKTKPTIEKNTKLDLTIFSELEKVKNTNISSYDLDKKITIAISTIYTIKNDYPKLEEKKAFKELIRDLNESDTLIDAAKSFYNTHNEKLINLIKSFPTNIICLFNKVKIKPYYEAKEIFNESDDGIKI